MRARAWCVRAGWAASLILAALVAGCDSPLSPLAAVQHFKILSAGPRFSCAVDEQGQTFCWGPGEWLELGNWKQENSFQPSRVAIDTPYVSVSSGYYHSCALTAAGIGWCWGWGILGQLGTGESQTGGPYFILHGPLAAISSGWYHSCGIDAAGSAWCWGSNTAGQLGDGTHQNRLVPVPVLGGLRFRSISAGGEHTCGVGEDGATYCWGGNGSGQLGNGGTEDALQPSPVAGSVRFSSVDAGFQHTCGLTDGGALYCWGSNGHGELGRGNVVPVGVPGSVAPESVRTALRFAKVDAGYARTCAVTSDGAAYCWGAGTSLQLGTGVARDEALPRAVLTPRYDGKARYVTVSASGLTHGCGLLTDGTVACWGRGDDGELGSNTFSSSAPIPVLKGP